MPIVIHTGDKRYNYYHPEQMKRVLDAFPNLTCICAHLGGWSEWDDAYKSLAKYDNVYVDTSSSLYAMEPEHAAKIIRQYATERVMFGTDYPMWNAKEELERIAAVPLTDRERELIIGQERAGAAGLNSYLIKHTTPAKRLLTVRRVLFICLRHIKVCFLPESAITSRSFFSQPASTLCSGLNASVAM